jgi:UDP-3-O-[3-hydroxymyristoyl] glucosamine N-acyltransferase
MKITASQLAALTGGILEGNPDAVVTRPMRIEDAIPGDFAFLDNPKYEHYAYSTGASVLMVSADFQPTKPVQATLLRVADVRTTLAALLAKFGEANNTGSGGGISDRAYVHPEATVGAGSAVGHFAVVEAGAVIGENCVIHPQVFIGKNTRVGNGTVLHSGVKLQYDCTIGENCIIHANAVIGTDGFGFAPLPDGTWKKVPQVGNVVIENDVEIGANTCIDRAALGSTIIHSGVKLDNLVQIAHNVEVGSNTAMAAQVGVAGSAKIGENCMLGGQSGIAGHISLAKGTRTQAQSGLGMNVTEPGKAFFGSPAIDYNEYVRAYIVFKQLPALAKKLREIEKKVMD